MTLSKAQKRVMILLAEGHTHGEAAIMLYLSVETARSHSKAVRQNLGVTSTDAAVERLRGLGLLD